MLRAIQRYFQGVSPAFVDGSLYVFVGLFAYLSTQFGSEEAAKYIGARALFFTKLIVGGFGSISLSLKLFRSTTFADHQADKKAAASAVVAP